MSDSKEKPKDSKRDTVLMAALQLMQEQGDLSFSLRKLADAAHTSTMAIYTYFGNREGLYRALATQAFATFAADVEHAMVKVGNKDARTILLKLAGMYRGLAQTHPSTFDLIFGGKVAFDRVEPLSDRFEGLPSPSANGYDVYSIFTDIVQQGVTEGVFRSDVPVRLLMDSYWAQLHGLVVLERTGYVRSPQDADERFAFGVQAILQGLGKP